MGNVVASQVSREYFLTAIPCGEPLIPSPCGFNPADARDRKPYDPKQNPRCCVSWGKTWTRGLAVAVGGSWGMALPDEPLTLPIRLVECKRRYSSRATPHGRMLTGPGHRTSAARVRPRELVAACLLRSDLAFAGWPPCDSPRLSLLGYLSARALAVSSAALLSGRLLNS